MATIGQVIEQVYDSKVQYVSGNFRSDESRKN